MRMRRIVDVRFCSNSKFELAVGLRARAVNASHTRCTLRPHPRLTLVAFGTVRIVRGHQVKRQAYNDGSESKIDQCRTAMRIFHG